MPGFRARCWRVRYALCTVLGEHAGTRRVVRLAVHGSFAPICQPRQDSARSSRAANGHEDAVADLDPAAIESLLQETARRRGVTVDAYRDFITAIADPAGVTFEKAVQVISDFERMPPDEFKALAESLVMLTAEAARYGVSVSSLPRSRSTTRTGNRRPTLICRASLTPLK